MTTKKPNISDNKAPDGPDDKPEVYSVKKNDYASPGSRRQFIAKSALAGAAVSLGAGQLAGCEGVQDVDKVRKSIHTITTKYVYASFKFSPDGKTLAVYASAEEDVNLWSIPGGKLIKTLKNVNKGIKGLQFTSDGKYLVVDAYTQINIWSLPDGVLLKTLEGNGDPFYQYQILQLELNPDGKTLAYKKYPETTIKICSIPNGTQLNSILDSGMTDAFFQFSPDGKNLITVYEGALHILTFPELNPVKTIETGPGFLYFYFSPDGKTIGSADKGKIKLWTFPEGTLFKTIEADANYTFFKFSNDGKLIASRGSDSNLKLWSLPDGNILYDLTQHSEKVQAICFNPDGTTFASSQPQTILLWSLKDSGVGLINTINENVDVTSHSRNICFSPDGKILASSYGKFITLWSVPDGNVIPAGACVCDTVCTCNTVSSGNTSDICTCNTVDFCTCNVICTCNTVCACDVDTGGGGRSYLYPN